jgi:hypothetical protein
MSLPDGFTGNYNLRQISLMPVMAELGIELRLFDEELRGGLLVRAGFTNVPQNICCYKRSHRKNNELLDEWFLTVYKRLRATNLFRKEDIREHNIIGKMFSLNIGTFLEKRFRYFIDWDPMALTMPCKPKNGNWLPIHYSAFRSFYSMQRFISVLNAGLQYFPEKLGFVFSKCTQRIDEGYIDEGEFSATPFQFLQYKYGHERATDVVVDRIAEYCCPASSTSDTTNASLLMSVVTDKSIHLDGLYILLRRDPAAALLRLQQHLLAVVVEDGQSITDTDTDNNTDSNSTNNNSNNNNNNNIDARSSKYSPPSSASTDLSMSMFQTAGSGTAIYVSEERLEDARRILQKKLSSSSNSPASKRAFSEMSVLPL